MKKTLFVIFVLVSHFLCAQISHDDMRAYYKFNGTLNDYSGNNLHGAAYGTLNYEEGVNCQSVAISDTPSNAIRLNREVLDSLADFSILFYGKIAGLNNSNNFLSGATSLLDNEFILSYNSVGTFGSNGWHIRIDDVSHTFDSDTTMNDNAWHHIVVTRENDKVSLYVDNVKIGSDIVVGSGLITIDSLILGQDQDCLGGCFQAGQNWHGQVDELIVYERALDSTEISEIYDEYNCVACSIYDTILVHDTVLVYDTITEVIYESNAIRAYYKFDSTLNDYSGNDFHGVAYGTLNYEEGVKCQSVTIADTPSNAIRLNHKVLDGLADFSILFYGKIAGLNNSNNFLSGATSLLDNEFILSYNSVGTFGSNGWHIRIDNVSHTFDSDTTMNDNEWHHIVVTRENDKASLYVDNVKIGNDIVVDSGLITIDSLILGQDQDCLGGCFQAGQNWHGQIDELIVYERALDSTEIDSIYEEYNCSTCNVWIHDTIVVYDTITEVIYDTVLTTVTDTLLIYVNIPNSLEQEVINEVKVFPNPTNDVLNITTDILSSEFNDYTLRIVSNIGVPVFEALIREAPFSIEISEFGEKGLFFLYVLNDEEIVDVKKLILK